MWGICVNLVCYSFQKVVSKNSKVIKILYAIEFNNPITTLTKITSAERVIESINKLTASLNLEKPDAISN